MASRDDRSLALDYYTPTPWLFDRAWPRCLVEAGRVSKHTADRCPRNRRRRHQGANHSLMRQLGSGIDAVPAVAAWSSLQISRGLPGPPASTGPRSCVIPIAWTETLSAFAARLEGSHRIGSVWRPQWPTCRPGGLFGCLTACEALERQQAAEATSESPVRHNGS